MTPLDFRLTAVLFFRLLNIHCDYIIEAIERIQEVFRTKRYTNRYLLSTSSFNQQVIKFIGTFHTEIDLSMISSITGSFIISSIRESNVYSALHTNAIQMTVPGSNIYRAVKNMYPIHDNASVSNVSLCC